MDKYPLLIIVGATASGKTRLAAQVAQSLSGEIISADSRQLFKGMDIGTGKDLKEYILNGEQIPYHLINIKEPGEKYNVNAFKDDFYRAFENISLRRRLAILCGGTGMYIHSILQNHAYTAVPGNEELRSELAVYDIEALRLRLATYPPQYTSHADLSSAKRLSRAIEVAEYLQYNDLDPVIRPHLNPLIIGLTGGVEERRERIRKRLNERFNEGLIEEVRGLLQHGVPEVVLLSYGLEYKFVTEYLQKKDSLEDLKENLYIAIRQFAKRQMTFFRKMEKDGVQINWLSSSLEPEIQKSEVLKLYSSHFHH